MARCEREAERAIVVTLAEYQRVSYDLLNEPTHWMWTIARLYLHRTE